MCGQWPVASEGVGWSKKTARQLGSEGVQVCAPSASKGLCTLPSGRKVMVANDKWKRPRSGDSDHLGHTLNRL